MIAVISYHHSRSLPRSYTRCHKDVSVSTADVKQKEQFVSQRL